MKINSIKNRVQKLKDKKEFDFDRTSYVLCKEFKWDYYTLMNQPIPFILSMMQQISKSNEEKEKAAKGRKGKRGKK